MKPGRSSFFGRLRHWTAAVFVALLFTHCFAVSAAATTRTVGAVVVGPRATAIERTAADYLVRFLSRHLGGDVTVEATTVPLDRSIVIAGPGSRRSLSGLSVPGGLGGLGEEGFIIGRAGGEAGRRFIVIAGEGGRSVLYGAFEIARRIALGEDPWTVEVRERPAFPFRCLWSWSQPTSRRKAFFNYTDMAQPEKCGRYRRFGELLASMRINAFCFWGDYGEGGASPHRLATIRRAYRRFTDFLKERYGVDSYVFAVYGMGTDFSQLCVHDPKVRRRWRRRIETLFGLYPSLKGVILAGAGGDWVRGPWECRCDYCRRHSDRELLLEAMRMIAGPMKPYGGRLIWKAVTDRPTLVHTEVEHFGRLTGLVPPNVWVSFKTFYKDFRPPHPYNAMFYRLEPHPPFRVPYVTEFQILGEYRGLEQFPCSMVERWAPIFRMAEERREQGVIGVVSAAPGRNIDHLLNGVNWYAFGRFGWNPAEPPEQVMRDWATLEFGRRAAPYVCAILRDSYRASVAMMFMKGIMTQNHSRLPSINYELESSLVGPWHNIPRAPEGYIGRAHDLSMYPREVAEAIRRDPRLLLFAHRVPLTPRLAAEGVAEKEEAIRAVRRMIAAWGKVRGAVGDETWEAIARGLRDNLADAELWKEDLALYLDYKLGRLTSRELDLRLKALRERFPRGGSKLSSGDSLREFFSEWQGVLDGTFKRRVMEGIHYTAPVADFPPGLADRR